MGVGQSETAVHSMVDMFMLLQISGAGDELQGIKRGIMEMADIMVITKADGENIHKAELAKTQFQGALRLFPVPESGWRPKVYTCSAVAATGLEEVWKGVEEFLDHIQANGYFRHNRNRQNKYWMYESINEVLRNSFYHDPAVYPAASLVRCVRPGIPIYVVDPGNPDTAGIRNPLTLIRKRAAEGMPGLAELLREKYAAG